MAKKPRTKAKSTSKRKKTSPKKKAPAKNTTKAKTRKSIKKKTAKKSTTLTLEGIVPVSAFGPSYVDVTYELTKSSDVSLDLIHFGATIADLEEDHDPTDDNKFSTRNGKVYQVLTNQRGEVRVSVAANGNMGGGWSMSVKINGQAIGDDPIEVEVQETGRADHNAFHS